jgi:hypothetical protein
MKNWLSKFAFTFSLYRYTAWEKRASEEEQAGKLATEMSLDEAKADGGDAMDHDGGGGGGGGGVDAAAAAAAAVEPVHTTATATAATPAATPAPGAADGAEEEEAATDEAAAAVRTYPDDASPVRRGRRRAGTLPPARRHLPPRVLARVRPLRGGDWTRRDATRLTPMTVAPG